MALPRKPRRAFRPVQVPGGKLIQQSRLLPVCLLDKGSFLECIRRSLARAKRHRDYPFAVLFIDLDRFNLVNEILGRAAADDLLAEMGRRLQQLLRAEDAVAHLSGDKFAVLLENTQEVTDAVHAAQRIQTILKSPTLAAGLEVFCRTSIGIALGGPSYNEPEELLHDAETAMYRAKDRGRGGYQVFDTALHEQSVHLFLLEADLHRVFDRNEFRLHYQPIVSIETGRIAGFEALLRWEHPQRGLLCPGDFIAVAERTGLIISIDEWVLREACRQVAEWQRQFRDRAPTIVSVNLASDHLARQELVQEISDILSEYELAPSSLALEITENHIMEVPELASTILTDLARLGIKIYIDDFGTGYSSLSYLARFPVHTLKIDRSFVEELGINQKCRSVIQAILSLADNLGLAVIAEGVETEEQLEYLRTVRCQLVQGYYLSRPLEKETVAWFIAKWDRLNRGAPLYGGSNTSVGLNKEES